MNSEIRALVELHAGLSGSVADLSDDADLYRAGMKSFATVQLMLGLEEAFGIEFPESMLTRETFRSIAAMEQAVVQLSSGAVAA